MNITLIDADILVYRAGYGAESAIEWEEGEFALNASLPQAKAEFDAYIEGLLNATYGDRAVLALSDTQANFRKSVYPKYKAQRNNVSARKSKPLVFKALRDHAREKFEVIQKPTLEADDVLGIIATGNIKGIQGAKTICSIDKDLLTIPGDHYNWDTKKEIAVSEIEAERAFYRQVLTGDAVDNYSGCPGVGPKTAEKILDAATGSYWKAVVEAYKAKGLTARDAYEQAICARILRAENYDFKNKTVILWTPPGA